MSGGVKAIVHLLSNNSDLNAVVPATRIMAGPLPQGATLPALAITQVSGTVRHHVAATSVLFRTDRVQVTVLAKTYASQRNVLELVRAAIPRSRGTVHSVNVDSILLELEGPDFTNDAGVYMGSVDYVINYNA